MRTRLPCKNCRRSDEFGFEEAVTAYEDLIGAYVWRQP